jgi:hypothetical protein
MKRPTLGGEPQTQGGNRSKRHTRKVDVALENVFWLAFSAAGIGFGLGALVFGFLLPHP